MHSVDKAIVNSRYTGLMKAVYKIVTKSVKLAAKDLKTVDIEIKKKSKTR